MFLILHRWAGLTIAMALVITGLTGAILPYQRELSHWLAPEIWQVEKPSPTASPLSGIEIAQRVQAETEGVVSYVPLTPSPERAHVLFVTPSLNGPALDYDEIFVDPYTSQIRAQVRYGDLQDGRINWLPFLMSFHYTLAAGDTGRLLMGVAALIWVGMSIIGIALSLPRLTGSARDMLKRWAPAWKIRLNAGPVALTHDFHRATGLWIWPIILVFAWSAVAFNLAPLHGSVQRFFGAEGLYQPVENPMPGAGTPMSWEEAVTHGERLMQREAESGGFAIRAPEALSIASYANAYGYYARTSLDEPSEEGATVVWFDQVSGKKLGFGKPFGSTSADAIDKAVRILHTADGLGWTYRMFVSLFGLLTAAMSAAGVLLWFRRSQRLPRIRPALT